MAHLPEKLPRPTTVVAVVDIADGNPAAARAEYIRRLHAYMRGRTDAPVLFVNIAYTARIGALFHRLMSSGFFGNYRAKSEASRTGLLGKSLQIALWLELAAQLDKLEASGLIIDSLVLIQEFPLLGAQLLRSEWLEKLRTITLVIPDVLPKESAKLAASQARAGQVLFLVWNDLAMNELRPEHIVDKSDQGIMHGFEQDLLLEVAVPVGYPDEPTYRRLLETDNKPFAERGVPVVVKSSGSGMPRAVLQRIREQLSHERVPHYEIHLPTTIEIFYQGRSWTEVAPPDKMARLRRFALALGVHTQRLICYPSELVGVVHEMRQMGSRVWLEVFDEPRGEHEQKNLIWAEQMQVLFNGNAP